MASKRGVPGGFDLVFSPIKLPSGEIHSAPSGVTGTFSVFGDTSSARRYPQLRAISQDGLPALPGEANLRDGFGWGFVCPTKESYRGRLEGLLRGLKGGDLLGLHLQDFQFPDKNYCYCGRCSSLFGKSGLDWVSWRAHVLLDFLLEIREWVSLPLSLTLYPDPLGLLPRFGLDLVRLSEHVEFFVIPLYDTSYKMTYLIESMAYDFTNLTDKPLFFELYTVEPEPRDILRALLSISRFNTKGVILYDPSFLKIPKLKKVVREDPEIRRKVKGIKLETFQKIVRRLEELPD